jgi:hypothetical protein
MKQILCIKIILLASLAAYCQGPNTWIHIAGYPGRGLIGDVSFSIGGKGYVGTGTTNFSEDFKDIWAYDTTTGAWTQMADFGGSPRTGAVGFSIDDKGYIGTGSSGPTAFKDFWEYDPIANIWVQKADFGGGNREFAAGFGIGGKGYIGTGDTGDPNFYPTKDFWEYDPANDTWTRKDDFGGIVRSATFGLAIGNKGYFLGGLVNGGYDNDFWEYDPATDTWAQKTDYGGGNPYGPAGFSLGNKGYVAAGYELWEYDPSTDVWTQKADVGDIYRENGVGFSIGNNGYIGIGIDPNYGPVNDFLKYWPSIECDPPANLKVPEVTSRGAVLRWTLPAAPADEFDISYRIFNDANGLTRHGPGTSSHIILTGLEPGTKYQWRIRSNCGPDTTNWVRGPDFKTLPAAVLASGVTAITMDDQVQVLPNPSSGNFVLQMQLPEKASSTIFIIYNSAGIKVWQQNAGLLSGFVSRKFSLQDQLQKGVYLLVVERDDKRLMQRLEVMK